MPARADLIVQGREGRGGEAPAWPWTWRRDRPSRVIGLAAAAVLLTGVSAVRSAEPPPRVHAPAADPAAGAVLYPFPGGVEVRPVSGPSAAAARRVAQLIGVRQCRNMERPRYRQAAGGSDGRSASYIVGRASDTPRKSAGFLLDLRWRDGVYVARISGAYGGCANG